jgi:hypothetical protein
MKWINVVNDAWLDLKLIDRIEWNMEIKDVTVYLKDGYTVVTNNYVEDSAILEKNIMANLGSDFVEITKNSGLRVFIPTFEIRGIYTNAIKNVGIVVYLIRIRKNELGAIDRNTYAIEFGNDTVAASKYVKQAIATLKNNKEF